MVRDWPIGVTLATRPCFTLGQSGRSRFGRATICDSGCGYLPSLSHSQVMVACLGAEGQVESNERYYRRRAVEERMAAQRAVTETARAWHSKLAEDFAQRAMANSASVCTQAANA